MANLVADARALSAGQFQHLVVYGSTALGDGGGGIYVWDAAETAADDGADFLKPSSVDAGSPGRWRRVWSAFTELPGRTVVTNSDATRTNTAADSGNWVRWTSTAAKTFTVANSVASAGDVWVGFNAGATGNLSLVAGSGVTLTGNLVFAPLKGYMIVFASASAADVVGGTAS